MGSAFSTVKTRILCEDVGRFEEFLKENGVLNFNVVVPKDSVFVYVQFLRGSEMMKYRLRGLEEEFIVKHGLSYDYDFDNAWQDIVDVITGDDNENEN